MRRRHAASPSPDSGSESDFASSELNDQKANVQRHQEPKLSGGRETTRKRRLVGEKLNSSESPSAAASEAPTPPTFSAAADVQKNEIRETALGGPPRFRYLGFALQTRAACLLFCSEVADEGSLLSALPREVIELIGRKVVAGNSVVRFMCPETLGCAATLKGHEMSIYALTCFTSSDGTQLLASGGSDGAIQLWNLASRQRVAIFKGHTRPVWSLASFSDRDGVQLLASGSEDSSTILWDVVKHTQVAKLGGHMMAVRDTVAFHDAGGIPFLASGSEDATVRLWDLQTRNTIATLSGHTDAVLSLCVFKDSRGIDILASGSLDTTINLWDLTTHENVFTLDGHENSVFSLTCFTNEDGVPMLVSSSYDRTIKVWDTVSRVYVATLDCDGWYLTALTCAAGADGRVLLACVSVVGRMRRLLDVSTGSVVFETNANSTFSCSVFVDSVSGAPFLALPGDKGIVLWTDGD
jgi:WD40 repeat protein